MEIGPSVGLGIRVIPYEIYKEMTVQNGVMTEFPIGSFTVAELGNGFCIAHKPSKSLRDWRLHKNSEFVYLLPSRPVGKYDIVGNNHFYITATAMRTGGNDNSIYFEERVVSSFPVGGLQLETEKNIALARMIAQMLLLAADLSEKCKGLNYWDNQVGADGEIKEQT
ncbi:MAG: hypothetical protein MUD10_05280 [Candidatus Pacebacteria bacterium]|jgi:hypothetical protein|nr:hypothetical protein [Candidatus Paceibacterota bacterium]